MYMSKYYLFVTPFFPSPKSWRGGYCYDMVKALMRVVGNRYVVKVLVPGDGVEYEYMGIHVSRFVRRTFPCGLAPFVFDGINKRHFGNVLRRIGVRAADIAICHVHTLDLAYVTEYVKAANPQVLTLLHHHCINPIRLDSGRLGIVPIHAMILYFYLRRLCEQVDIHVFCSEQSRKSYGKLYKKNTPELGSEDLRERLWWGRLFRGIRLPRAVVLYNGIDTRAFHPDETIKRRKVAPRMLNIGCVGNFQPFKGQMTLIKAIDILHSEGMTGIKVRFIGSGVTLSDCQRYVCEHGLSEIISFEKEIDHLSLPNFYRSLDLFVLPSRTEGFCCAYIEAIGCGVPVIGCRGVSLEEVIPNVDKWKWLIVPCDYNDLAAKIRAYITNRWTFQINRSLDIDKLWKEFVDSLNQVL